jgi:hypothetical protein
MRQKIVAHFGVTICRKSLKNEPLGKIDMKILKVAVALGLATSLSACLSDDVVDDGIDTAAALSLFERADLDNGVLADVDTLPSSATMTGVIGAAITSDDFDLAFLGDMTVEADFENGAMTGKATNIGLYSFEGECRSNADCEAIYQNALDGELVMSNSVLIGNEFTADLAGTLSGAYSDPDGTGTMVSDVTLSTDGAGGFFRDSEGLFAQAGLTGSADSDFTTDEGTQNIVSTLVGEMVVAE